jgi:peroxiredoxin family protein
VTAAVISTSEPQRLYSGLSVLVSAAVDGEECAALLAFAGLELFLSPLEAGDEAFTRSLRELRRTALDLDNLRLYACAASVELAQAEHDLTGLDGVMSTPRFLREAAAERLLFV